MKYFFEVGFILRIVEQVPDRPIKPTSDWSIKRTSMP